MIKLFGITDTTFSSNGDLVLKPTKAKVVCKDNGQFYLDLETGLEYADELTEGRIIIAPTPDGEQAFRVHDVKKTRFKVTSKCRHVFFDSENYLIKDSYSVNNTANDALIHFNAATDPTSPFSVLSDVGGRHSIRLVRKSLLEAFQEVTGRYGGHFVRNNWSFQLKDSIGADNGIVIRYAKNLKNISCSYNWDKVVTKLLPTGYEGITLPEVYINAPVSYDIPYTKTVAFNQTLKKEDYDSDAAFEAALIVDLRSQATDYIIRYSVPQVNYTLSASVDAHMGDVIQVVDERLGVSILTNVIAYEYDAILKRITQVEFGNFKNDVSNLLQTITSTATNVSNRVADDLSTRFTTELSEATAAIWQAMGSSYVIYDTDKILIVDTLPKEDATNCMIFNSGGIGFSTTGITGTFNSVWSIDGTFDASVINVINLNADNINTGTIQDATGNNYWNLVTGELRMTGVGIGIGAKNNVRHSNYLDFEEYSFAFDFTYNGDTATLNGVDMEVLYHG